MEQTKEVRFDLYCKKCKHWNLEGYLEPCNECLTQGWNIDSHKPIRFEEKN